VDLTNDKWAEFREISSLNAGDRLAIRRVQKVPMGEWSQHEVSGAWQDEMRVALLQRVIVGWNYEGWPIPSITPDPQTAVLQVPIEDYDILTVEIQPYLDKVDYYPSPKNSGESNSTSED
jgi:hypothetical protein